MTAPIEQRANPPEAQDLAMRLARLWPRLVMAATATSLSQMRAVNGLDYSLIDYQGIIRAAQQFSLEWWLAPHRAWAAQAELWRRQCELIMAPSRGSPTPGPAAGSGDKRFQDQAWSEDPALRLARDLYLVNGTWLLEQVRAARSLADNDRRKLEFYARQLLSALSPSNHPGLNPRVRARALETNGLSVVIGLESLLHDIEQGHGLLPISQHDAGAFEVGRNLATTPGKVVYRNPLIELIQYAPLTTTVHRAPLLFVPPWINKYYVLDLQPENSFLRYVVEQGHTVFVISWANPGATQAATGLDDYLRGGLLTAVRVVQEITGEPEVNLGGFCIGGILTLCALAWLSAGAERPVRSATFLATMVDLSNVGEASVFIDEAQLQSIERHTRRTGYLDGCHMKDMFSLLRENDLVWSYVVGNYLLGRTPPAFDILHWNADSTRLPARMLTEFLRGLYVENSLVRPGRLRLAGRPIDIGRIATPCYFLSTVEDHIAPWRASYPATQLLNGPVELVLAGSGHIAGIVNPPARKKYGYRTSPDHPPDPDSWLAGTTHHSGSWWPHWAAWLAAQAGERVPARAVGSRKHPPLFDAPGHYVLGT